MKKMTNEMEENDDYREATMLLSTTVRQLDDVLSKRSPFKLFSTSRTSVSNMNANDDDPRATTPQRRSMSASLSNHSALGRMLDSGFDFNQNGIHDSDLSDSDQIIERNLHANRPQLPHQNHSTVSRIANVPKIPMAWDTSVSNWIEESSKVTPESSGSCTPETSTGDSPQSEMVHSSSANGLDDPSPANIITPIVHPLTQPAPQKMPEQSPPSPVDKLLKAIDEDRVNVQLNAETQMKILRWLNKQNSTQMSPSPSMSTVSCPEYPELQEKIHRLAMARDSYSLQVTVLNEQVGAQKERIQDLESILAVKRYSYNMPDHLTPAERADLMKEIIALKNKYAALEKDKQNAERRLQLSQQEIERLSQSIHQMMHHPGNNFHHPSNPQQMNAVPSNDPNFEMEQLRTIVKKLLVDNEQKSLEINSLRTALDEHSRVMENLTMSSARSSLNQVPPPAPQPFNLNAQLRKLLVEDSKENIAHSNSFPTNLCNGNQQNSAYGTLNSRNPVQPSTSYNSSLAMLSPQPSWSSGTSAPARNVHQSTSLMAPSSSFGSSGSPTNTFRSPSSPAARQLAAELDELRRMNGEFSMQQHGQYSTSSLPRQLQPKMNSSLSLPKGKLSSGSGGNGSINGEYQVIGSRRPPSPAQSSGSSYSKRADGSRGSTNAINRWIQDKLLGGEKKKKRGPPTSASTRPYKLGHVYDDPEEAPKQRGLRSTSAPNLGPRGIDKLIKEEYYQSGNKCSGDFDLESDDELLRTGQQPQSARSNFKRGRTRSTLRNFLGKLTRSTSQEIPGGFRRGSGIRASASARLANVPQPSGAVCIRPPVQQFVDWNTDQICEWLTEVGFAQYVPEAEKYVRSGRHLLNMPDNEIEKELQIKNPLHRKRLKCVLDCIDKNAAGPADRMDVHQVLLWLDLIGLPQFRDAFSENMIDGQMLLCLTAQDLVEMKIISALNHASLSRAIQFLASVDFHIHRLEKNFSPDLLQKCPIPNEVVKWSYGCVSHWLKSIDLAEFTGNLLFTGIHGALMVYEPTFTAESLAEVLKIPPHRTLIRRHLTTHFNHLIGQDIITKKRETLGQPCVTYLTPLLRVKLTKKGFSLPRKKNKNEVYVEPTIAVFSPRALQYEIAQAHPQNTDI